MKERVTIAEAGHRLGVTATRISLWGKLGYFRVTGSPGHRKVDWREVMSNRLMQREMVLFLERLAKEDDSEFLTKTATRSRRVEPEFKREERK